MFCGLTNQNKHYIDDSKTYRHNGENRQGKENRYMVLHKTKTNYLH